MSTTPCEASIRQAANLLRSGGLVVFPTETVYGLGACAFNPDAVREIFVKKGRPSANPLIVHLSDIEAVSQVAILHTRERELLRKFKPFMPGPLTVVLPRASSVPDIVTGGQSTVAVRIPKHPVALALLREVGGPVAAPSANRSNYVSPTTAQHVADEYDDNELFILDGGQCSVGIESTVLSLVDGKLIILRPGTITRADLEEALGESVEEFGNAANAPAVAPGMSLLHYAPHTSLRLFEGTTTAQGPAEAAVLLSALTQPPPGFRVIRYLSDSGDLAQVARTLFSVLRELDTLGLEGIAVEVCSDNGIGIAIRDRLVRAAKRGFRE